MDYSNSNADGASAIALNYLYEISFFTCPTDVLNPTAAADEFFSFDNRTYERMWITGDGRMGVNATDPNYRLRMAGEELSGINGTSKLGVGVRGRKYKLLHDLFLVLVEYPKSTRNITTTLQASMYQFHRGQRTRWA